MLNHTTPVKGPQSAIADGIDACLPAVKICGGTKFRDPRGSWTDACTNGAYDYRGCVWSAVCKLGQAGALGTVVVSVDLSLCQEALLEFNMTTRSFVVTFCSERRREHTRVCMCMGVSVSRHRSVSVSGHYLCLGRNLAYI